MLSGFPIGRFVSLACKSAVATMHPLRAERRQASEVPLSTQIDLATPNTRLELHERSAGESLPPGRSFPWYAFPGEKGLNL